MAEKVKEEEKTINDTEFLTNTNAIIDEAENQEENKQKEKSSKAWDETDKRIMRAGESYKAIDDHMIEQLPTFMTRRYANGEFGDTSTPEGKKEAKLRLAHFMINSLGTALSNMSHVINKDGQQEESDYEKYQRTNIEQGLENRWNKYKAETNNAVETLKNRGIAEEEIDDARRKISSNQRLQTAFNMMNENQKVYCLEVVQKIGDKIGNFDNNEFLNYLVGLATTDPNFKAEEAATLLVAKFGKEGVNTIVNKIANGGVNDGKADTNKASNKEERLRVNFDENFTTSIKELNDKVNKGEISLQAYKDAIAEIKETYKENHPDTENFDEDFAHMDTNYILTDEDVNKKYVKGLYAKISDLNKQGKNGDIGLAEYDKKFDELKKQLIDNGEDSSKVNKERLSHKKFKA